MFRILKLVLLAAVANCAPATFIPFSAPLAQSYFYFGPQPQPQLQYQPLLKIQQPLAPASTINKIDTPKNQYVFLYPSAPQPSLFALRQGGEGGGFNWEEGYNNFWNYITQSITQIPGPPPATEQPAESPAPAPATTDTRIMLEKNAQTMPLLPASTMPLNMDKQRFYLINSLPQFYGNFAALPPATISNPILAIEQLRARSAIDSIPAENRKVEQSQDVVQLAQQPALVQPIPQLQLRSNIVEPLQRLEINQPQIPVVDNEPVPEVAAQQLARFLNEARSQDAGPNTGNMLNENDANKLRAEEKPLEEETSIAQAKPSGIALSGKGGVSSSAPTATAVVGEGGLALASPSAISLSGDFEDEEKKMKSL